MLIRIKERTDAKCVERKAKAKLSKTTLRPTIWQELLFPAISVRKPSGPERLLGNINLDTIRYIFQPQLKMCFAEQGARCDSMRNPNVTLHLHKCDCDYDLTKQYKVCYPFPLPFTNREPNCQMDYKICILSRI